VPDSSAHPTITAVQGWWAVYEWEETPKATYQREARRIVLFMTDADDDYHRSRAYVTLDNSEELVPAGYYHDLTCIVHQDDVEFLRKW